MKNNWIITSILSGIVGGIFSYLLINNWKLAFISSIIVAIIVLMNNPKRRYMKAFWVVLSMVVILNKYYFEIIGNLSDTHFKIGSNETGDLVSIFLIILAITCLILDFFERNGKLKGTFLSVKKNNVGDIHGDGNTINQTNV